ncbi:carcinine transporter-like [Ctenocephalides felis]|uniref:carcinine transporter-like n=1 Tax=Ctenocephalides felis TaxID=7515 RepID=UPI000E6E4272|nr:carcinine transporter-like [Ctenocephalides felis]
MKPSKKASAISRKVAQGSPLNDDEKSKDDGKLLDFDDVLPHIGEFGVYQKVLFLLMIPYAFFVAFVYFTQIFITVAPEEHWCYVPELAHLTAEERLNLAIPRAAPGEGDKAFTYSQCVRYDVNFTELLENGTLDLVPNPNWPVRPCDQGWEFDFSEIPYASITAEMEWVCQNAALPSFAQAIFFCGAIVGGLLFGWVADRYGRIPALTGTNVVGFLAGMGTAFVTNFWQFCLCRFLIGMAFDNCFTMMYILVLEYTGPKWRTFVTNMALGVFFATATCSMAWLAAYIDDWRKFTLITAMPMAFGFLVPFIIPESARWLLSQGKVKRGMKIIRRIARVNRKVVDERLYEEFIAGQQIDESMQRHKYTILDLFRAPELRKNVLLIIIVWIGVSIVYDGHVKNLENTGWKYYLSFTIASATESPADLLLIVTLDYFGKRWMNFVTLMGCAVFGLLAACVPIGVPSASLFIISRFFINITFNIGLQYAVELIPTVVRAQGMTFIMVMGSTASMVTPFISQSADVFFALPLFILGGIAITIAFLCLLLPETAGRELPQTLADGETFFKGQKFWEFPCLKRNQASASAAT